MRSFVDKKGVLFDLDGTLVDSKPGIFAAIRYTFRELQLPELSEEDMIVLSARPLALPFEMSAAFPTKRRSRPLSCFGRITGKRDCTNARSIPV